MKVTYFPASKAGKGKSIERVLIENHIKHERVNHADTARRARLGKLADLPTVEINGRLFVNPNDHALRKLLELEPPDSA